MYKELGIHNIKVQNTNKYHMDIYHKDQEIYKLVVVPKLTNKTPQQIYIITTNNIYTLQYYQPCNIICKMDSIITNNIHYMNGHKLFKLIWGKYERTNERA